MPKKIGSRRGRFNGPYRFAPSEPPDDSTDAAAAARGTNHTPRTGPKPRIKGIELVFLVNWLDWCIDQGDDDRFQETLVKEFQKRFGRVVSAKTAEGKVVVYLQELAGKIGSKYVSKREVVSKGSRCIEWHRAPEELVLEYNDMRHELGLPLIIADEEETERNKLFRASESDSTSTSNSEHEQEPEPEPVSRLEPQPPSSSRPSPFQHQPSPVSRKPPASITREAKFTKTTIIRTITPPVSVPIQAESEEVVENATRNQESSETDFTVASKEHEGTDQTDQTDLSQMNWQPSIEQYGANEPPDAKDAKIETLSNMVSWLLQRHRDGWTGSNDELETLESVRKEVVSDRDDVFESLLDQLTGEERKTTKYESIIKSLVGRVSAIEPETVHTPQAPFTKAVDGEWTLLWDRCRLLTRSILADRKFTEPDFQRLYESIDVTFSNDPHYKDIIQQSAQYLSAHKNNVLLKLHGSLARLLFIFVFEYPTPLLESQHSDLLRHLYTMIGAAGDMSEVKRLDLLATEMLLKEDRVQNALTHQKAEQRCSWISQMLGLASSSDPHDTIARDLGELCSRAIKLYSKLLVSPLEYCIHFFQQGTTFDEPSMRVEDPLGNTMPTSWCIGKTVKLCLFPAIWQYCDQPLNKSRDVADALTVNRKFLRTHMGDLKVHLSLVAKAVVILE
ncbi:hypothetical protein PMIN06_011184 [Paraphaeosphaeria minitans]|uniref:Uncharacterized protein n=1 Tax=Paraphaeosphaeria minitans TaxID=565426 RepID=A0A9P6GU33_9PLEO|nr:hypothetical protein PMIN01_01097 [Paraphaeosphaeria minitans]